MIHRYEDKIETLLVFVSCTLLEQGPLIKARQAGLFSAVLTMFIAQTYLLLQPDPMQPTVDILQQILLQMQVAVNQTQLSLVSTSAPFYPSTSSITVNILFLSLLLSLASALFVILLKQWFCEYLSWVQLPRVKSPVALRQFRFASLSSWGVHGIVASLPALLEAAVVLFVCGLMVLLWTMNGVVASTVTVAAALLLAAVVLPTILPNVL